MPLPNNFWDDEPPENEFADAAAAAYVPPGFHPNYLKVPINTRWRVSPYLHMGQPIIDRFTQTFTLPEGRDTTHTKYGILAVVWDVPSLELRSISKTARVGFLVVSKFLFQNLTQVMAEFPLQKHDFEISRRDINQRFPQYEGCPLRQRILPALFTPEWKIVEDDLYRHIAWFKTNRLVPVKV